MSSLRIIGIVLSIIIFVFSIAKNKKRQFRKPDLFWGTLVSASIFLISLEPDIIRSAADILAGRYEKTGRLLSLVIIFNFFMLFMILRLISKINLTDRRLGDLVQDLAVSDFSRQFPEGEFERKIVAVIPAYNEESNLNSLLNQMPKQVFDYDIEALVVVDGSTDNTERIARQMGLSVIVHRINRGGGAALRAGYKVALQKNAEIVVTLDADGQHLPSEIERLVEPIIKDRADVVSGSRILGEQENGSQVRQAGIFFFNILISLLLRRKITDCSNAFRALKVSELEKLELHEDQFHTTELIIEAINKGIRFVEVPVTILKRQSGETKKPGSLSFGYGFLKAMLKTWWRG